MSEPAVGIDRSKNALGIGYRFPGSHGAGTFICATDHTSIWRDRRYAAKGYRNNGVMKIEIMGYSGSGKSTLCRLLSEKYNIPALHLDTVHFLPDWKVRDDSEQQSLVTAFMDNNPDGWVIDGNYTRLSYDRRVEEADVIILMLFGRINCLWRCIRRYHTYKGKNRPAMTEGCNEKLDWEFVKWILWEGRTRRAGERYKKLREMYPEKTVVIKNQKQLNTYMNENCLCPGGCSQPYTP